MQYKKFTKQQAKEFVEGIDQMSDSGFSDLVVQWKNHQIDDFDPSYQEIRSKTIDIYEKYKNISDYEVDVQIGLALYSEMNNRTGFTTVMANDDDIWRYLSCKVFPDITYERYPPTKKDLDEGHRLNTKRFYLHTRRIWLKTLWWYIHLSWQGSEKTTYSVVKHFGTDTISDLYERPGKGYRLKLYRELMKAYSQVENKNSDLFNQIQKRNLVNCRTVEPALTEGEEEGYIKRLFNELSL